MSIFVISKSKIPLKFVIFVCRSGKIFSGSQKKNFLDLVQIENSKKKKQTKLNTVITI